MVNNCSACCARCGRRITGRLAGASGGSSTRPERSRTGWTSCRFGRCGHGGARRRWARGEHRLLRRHRRRPSRTALCRVRPAAVPQRAGEYKLGEWQELPPIVWPDGSGPLEDDIARETRGRRPRGHLRRPALRHTGAKRRRKGDALPPTACWADLDGQAKDPELFAALVDLGAYVVSGGTGKHVYVPLTSPSPGPARPAEPSTGQGARSRYASGSTRPSSGCPAPTTTSPPSRRTASRRGRRSASSSRRGTGVGHVRPISPSCSACASRRPAAARPAAAQGRADRPPSKPSRSKPSPRPRC